MIVTKFQILKIWFKSVNNYIFVIQLRALSKVAKIWKTALLLAIQPVNWIKSLKKFQFIFTIITLIFFCFNCF